jgi:hypothetical protein
MKKRADRPFQPWRFRTLAVAVLLVAVFPVGAPSVARVPRRRTSTCPNPLPPVTQTAVIDLTHGLKVNDVTIDNTATEEVVWKCVGCSANKWVAIFDQTQGSPFSDYIFHDGGAAEHSGQPVVAPLPKKDQCFKYTVYVGNQMKDPQVIIKGTGIQ